MLAAACDFFSRIHKGKTITAVEKPPISRVEEDELHGDPDQWLVHAATVQRKHVLLVIHLKTRYCMLFFDMKKVDSAGFVRAFTHRWLEGVLDLMLKCGVLDRVAPPMCKKIVSDAGESYRMVQRSDRSSQGQLNEILRVFKWDAEEFDFVRQPWSALRYDAGINRTPRTIKGIKGYGYPVEEMLVHWLMTVGGVDALTAQEVREKFRQVPR